MTLHQSLALEPADAAERLRDCTVTSEDEFFDADDDGELVGEVDVTL